MNPDLASPATEAVAPPPSHEDVDRIARELFEAVTSRPAPRPGATYRVQVNRGFRLDDVAAQLGYMHDLGITDVYFSPYFEARPGSTHGYDVFDHSRINPEIGNDATHRRMLRRLADRGMGRVLDIVPNHMGVAGANRYWLDVLELGPQSACASYFDIEWRPVKEELTNRVLLPILGDLYSKVLEGGTIELVRDEGAFRIAIYDHRLPLEPRSYPAVMLPDGQDRDARFAPDDEDWQEYVSIADSARALPPRTDLEDASVLRVRRERDVIQRRLARLVRESPRIAAYLDERVASFRGTPGEPASFDALHALLEQQGFRLAFWRVASEEINYRRFFDINDLAGVRVEDEAVFDAIHSQVLRWVSEGGVSGLRIDHPDGLADPKGYFGRLQEFVILDACRKRFEEEGLVGDWPHVAERIRERHQEALRADPRGPAARWFPIVAEKILTGDEPLPGDWPIDGTVGYEYLNVLNGVFVDPAGREAIEASYAEFTDDRTPFEAVRLDSKRLIASTSMASELNMLARLLEKVARRDRRGRDITLEEMRRALLEVVACFPIYRTYIRPGEPLSERDRAYIDGAIECARTAESAVDATVFDFLRLVLLGEPTEGTTPAEGTAEEQAADALAFATRFQQTTAPVEAKGLEDTTFYRQVKLASLNEVGGDPTRFGRDPSEFHALNQSRLRDWPGGLSTTATHDTKRGEDTRIRINVLSEIPDAWNQALPRWREINAGLKVEAKGLRAPDAREEYLYYQTLLGVWPFDHDEPVVPAGLVERLQQYMVKVVREAKLNTNWTDPDTSYVEAISSFVEASLTGPNSGTFLAEVIPLARRVARVGVVHSLGQVLLKLASPGLPDIYQGNSLWDLSLVDPDNRRPVDYEARAAMLRASRERLDGGTPRHELVEELQRSPGNGAIKQLLTATVLQHRKANLDLYAEGDYLPLTFEGEHAGRVIGFARSRDGRAVLVLAARLAAPLMGDDGTRLPVGPEVWGDTRVVLPDAARAEAWRDVWTGQTHGRDAGADGGSLRLADLLSRSPLALLEPA